MGTDIIEKIEGWLLFAAILLAIGGFTMIGYKYGFNSAVRGETESVDTTYVHDTIIQYEPILEERVVYKREYVPVPVTDTLWKHDTLYVSLDHEQIVWQDSLSKVYASGILPQIDSVQHFISERVVTRELTKVVKKPCRWGIGVHAGYGIQLGEQVRTTPYIGVGVSYNILSW